MNVLPTLGFAMVAMSAALQAGLLFRRDGRPDPVSHWILLAAAAALIAVVIDRSLAIGFPP